MLHRHLQDLLDEMLDDPNELFIDSKSKHAALIVLKDGSSFLIEGDFSGSPKQCEAEARRILSDNHISNRRVRS
jgi:hypothetical protein